MAIQEAIQRESKTVKKAVKRRVGKREVVLSPELYDAVLESQQQVQEGKVLSQDEVEQRNGL